MLRSVPLLFVLAVGTGCASVSVSPAPGAYSGAERAAAEGDHRGAARAWVAAAGEARGAARDHAWLMAADQYLLAGDSAAARQAFAEVGVRRLQGGDVARAELIAATFLADDGGFAAALSRMSTPSTNVPSELRIRWHTLRADLLERSDRPFEAAAELALMAGAMDRAARGENVRRIERLLGEASDTELASGSAALPPGHPLYPYAGRVLVRRGLPLPRPLERGQASAGLVDFPPADGDGYRPPVRLGVLLPLSGPLATAGQDRKSVV